MPSIEAGKINELFKNMPEDPTRTYLDEREDGKNREKRPLPEGMTLKPLDFSGVYAELIEKPGNDGPLIMYIHGGGFKTGAAEERREITIEIAEKYGSNVIANNYRLAPENKWPAQLDDCVTVYQGILDMGYEPGNIVIAGESAGASLAVALILYLIDNKKPLPKACVFYSGSIIHCGHFRSHTENAGTDYMLKGSVASDDDIPDIYGTGDHAKELASSRYASPYNTDLKGFVPTFIAVSDSEALFDDSRIFHEKLTEAGVNTKIHIGHDLIHAYPIFPDLPESVETMKETFEFIDSL